MVAHLLHMSRTRSGKRKWNGHWMRVGLKIEPWGRPEVEMEALRLQHKLRLSLSPTSSAHEQKGAAASVQSVELKQCGQASIRRSRTRSACHALGTEVCCWRKWMKWRHERWMWHGKLQSDWTCESVVDACAELLQCEDVMHEHEHEHRRGSDAYHTTRRSDRPVDSQSLIGAMEYLWRLYNLMQTMATLKRTGREWARKLLAIFLLGT